VGGTGVGGRGGACGGGGEGGSDYADLPLLWLLLSTNRARLLLSDALATVEAGDEDRDEGGGW